MSMLGLNWLGNETAYNAMTSMPKAVADKLTDIGERPKRVGGYAGEIKKAPGYGGPSGIFIWDENGKRVQAPAGWQMSEQDRAEIKEWTDFRDEQIRLLSPRSPASVPGGMTAAPTESPVLGSTFSSVSTPWDARGIVATAPKGPSMPTPTTTQASRAKPGDTFSSTFDPWQPKPFQSPFAQAASTSPSMPTPPPSSRPGPSGVSMPAPKPIGVPVTGPNGVQAPGIQMDGPTPQAFPRPPLNAPLTNSGVIRQQQIEEANQRGVNMSDIKDVKAWQATQTHDAWQRVLAKHGGDTAVAMKEYNSPAWKTGYK